jgi:hypothetical protein
MKWCFRKGWASDLHLDEEREDTERVANGTLSATQYFLKYCDEKLTNENFNDDGNRFAEKYFGENGLYLQDYADNFGDLMYVAPESTHDFEAFSLMMEARLTSTILTTAEANEARPWWKFW